MKFPLGRSLFEEVFDLVYFLIGEAQIAGAHDSLCLPGIAGANDGAGHGGMVQRPGDCDFPDRTVVAVANLPQTLDQRQIARKIRFRKVRMFLCANRP